MQIQTLFSKNLKKYRKKAKLTQEELAEMCDSDFRYIGQIETGTRCPSLEFVDKIANALNIAPFLLFFDENDNLRYPILSSEEIGPQCLSVTINIEQAVSNAVDKAFSRHYSSDQKTQESMEP